MDTPYLAGLDLRDRCVVVIGGGVVAQRRLPTLLSAGAEVLLVSPHLTPAVEALADTAALRWEARKYRSGDLAGAWYAMALTDDPQVNADVVAEATERQIFCVRADDATAGTATTPATGTWGEVRVAVASARLSPDRGQAHRHQPLRTAAVRDSLLQWLQSGAGDGVLQRRLATTRPGDPVPGVALVGAGPGDPELITVAGQRLLARADVVVADRLAPQELLAQLAADVQVIDAAKLPRGRFMAQEAINACLVEHALAGRFVVRLKGGDPYVFGRGSEELLACVAAGVPVTVVPGVSSAISVPALAGIPLTHRGVAHEAVVVSGHLPPGHPESLVDWSALGRLTGTVSILMGVQNLAAIVTALLAGGRDPETPAAVVQDGAGARQRVITASLAQIVARAQQADVRAPAVIVVGAVVGVLPHDSGRAR